MSKWSVDTGYGSSMSIRDVQPRRNDQVDERRNEAEERRKPRVEEIRRETKVVERQRETATRTRDDRRTATLTMEDRRTATRTIEDRRTATRTVEKGSSWVKEGLQMYGRDNDSDEKYDGRSNRRERFVSSTAQKHYNRGEYKNSSSRDGERRKNYTEYGRKNGRAVWQPPADPVKHQQHKELNRQALVMEKSLRAIQHAKGAKEKLEEKMAKLKSVEAEGNKKGFVVSIKKWLVPQQKQVESLKKEIEEIKEDYKIYMSRVIGGLEELPMGERIAQKVSSPSSTISIETLERQCGERIERELERVKSQMDKKEIVSWHMPEIQQWFSDLREEKTWLEKSRTLIVETTIPSLHPNNITGTTVKEDFTPAAEEKIRHEKNSIVMDETTIPSLSPNDITVPTVKQDFTSTVLSEIDGNGREMERIKEEVQEHVQTDIEHMGDKLATTGEIIYLARTADCIPKSNQPQEKVDYVWFNKLIAITRPATQPNSLAADIRKRLQKLSIGSLKGGEKRTSAALRREEENACRLCDNHDDIVIAGSSSAPATSSPMPRPTRASSTRATETMGNVVRTRNETTVNQKPNGENNGLSLSEDVNQTVINVVHGDITRLPTRGGIVVVEPNGNLNEEAIKKNTNCDGVCIEEAPMTMASRVDEQELRWCYLRSLRKCEEEGQRIIEFPILGLERIEEGHALRLAYQAVLAHLEATPNTTLTTITFVAPNEKTKTALASVMGEQQGSVVIRSAAEARSNRFKLEGTALLRNRSVVSVTSDVKVGSWIATWGATTHERKSNQRKTQVIAGLCADEARRKRRLDGGDELLVAEAVRKADARHSNPELRVRESEARSTLRRTGGEEYQLKDATRKADARHSNPELRVRESEARYTLRRTGGEEYQLKDATRKADARHSNPELRVRESEARSTLRRTGGEEYRLKDVTRKADARHSNPELRVRESEARYTLRRTGGEEYQLKDATRKADARHSNPELRVRESEARSTLRRTGGEEYRLKDVTRKADARHSNPELRTRESEARSTRRLENPEESRLIHSLERLLKKPDRPRSYSGETPRAPPAISRRRESLANKRRNDEGREPVVNNTALSLNSEERETLLKSLPVARQRHYKGKQRKINRAIPQLRQMPAILGRRIVKSTHRRILRKYRTIANPDVRHTMTLNDLFWLFSAGTDNEKDMATRSGRTRLYDKYITKNGARRQAWMAVDYLTKNIRTGRPSLAQKKAALLECSEIYNAVKALAEQATKTRDRCLRSLLGTAAFRLDGKFKNDYEKAVLEVAGPHTHVKTHDPRDQQQTEQYGNMDVLYPALIERIGGDVNITEKDKEPSVLPTAAAVPTVSRNEDSMAVCSTQPQPAPVSDRNEAIKRSSRGATRENQNNIRDTASLKPLRYINRRTDCFLIAALNILNRLPGFREAVINYRPDATQNPDTVNALRALKAVMEMTLDEVQETGGRATVEVLRNEMGAQYANEASPYPNGDAVGWILERLPEEITKNFSFYRIQTVMCQSCGCPQGDQMESKIKLLNFNTTRLISCLEEDLDNAGKNEEAEFENRCCGECGQRGSKQSISYEFPPECKYLFALCNRAVAGGVVDQNQRFTDYNPAGNHFLGEEWKLLGMTENIPGTAFNMGHNVTWLVEPSGRVVLSNDSAVGPRGAMKTGLEGCEVLLFKRISVPAESRREESGIEQGNAEEVQTPDQTPGQTRTTFMREAGTLCSVEVQKGDWPFKIREMLGGLDQLRTNEAVHRYLRDQSCCECDSTSQKCHPEQCLNIVRLLQHLYPHYGGIRSITRRLFELRKHLRWLLQYEDAEKGRVDFSKYKELCSADNLSSEMKKVKAKTIQKMATDEDHHTEEFARTKFGKPLKNLSKELLNTETNVCECCRRLFKEHLIRTVPADDTNLLQHVRVREEEIVDSDEEHGEEDALITSEVVREEDILIPNEEISQEDALICNECWNQLKKGTLPDLSIRNGLQLDTIPPQLAELTWLEMLVLRRIRSMMCMLTLHNAKGGHFGAHRGVKGTVMHIPMPVENTLEHLVNRLPSMQGVMIRVPVQASSGKIKVHFINKDKVFRAAEWLKKNNTYYKDVVLSTEAELDQELREAGIEHPAEEQPAGSVDHFLTLAEVPTTVTTATTIDPEAPKGDPLEVMMNMRRLKGEAINHSRIIDSEAKMFPDLFPRGRGHFRAERANKISIVRYIHRNFRLADRRFINDQYAIIMNDLQDFKTLTDSININAKKLMNAAEFRKKMESNELDTELNTMFRALRSHADYWRVRREELKTVMKYHGPPIWFLTLNPAENEWDELRTTYVKVYQHMDVSAMTTTELTVMDAMLFVRHFAQRIRAVYKHMLLGPNGVLGNGVHFWRRIEYQLRGAPHCHGLLWILDAPVKGLNSREEIIQYVDSIVTTRIPEALKEAELNRLVLKFQMHECIEATCIVKKRIGGVMKQWCRFLFPYEVQAETTVVDPSESENPLQRSKTVLLKRPPGSERVNAYSPVIMLGWKGNMDLQYLGETSLANIEYITSYVGKEESKAKTEDFIQFLEKMPKSEAFRIAFQTLRLRQLGIPEICERLSGQHLHDCDSSVEFMFTDEPNKRVRVLKSSSELQKLKPGEQTTWPNLYDNHYPNRPPALGIFSLFVIFTALRFVRDLKGSGNQANTIEDDRERAEEDELCEVVRLYQNNMKSLFYMFPRGSVFLMLEGGGGFVARIKPILARMFLPNLEECLENEEKAEDYFRRLLFMFKPWRDEKKDLIENLGSYAEAWVNFWDNCEYVTKDSLQMLLERTQQMYDAAKERSLAYAKRRAALAEMNVEEVAADELDDIEIMPRTVDIATTMEEMQQLNIGQNSIFADFTEEIELRAAAEEEGVTRPPRDFYVSGYAGTGKSRLINVFANYVHYQYRIEGQEGVKPAVLIAAPTGLAAVNVGGSTLHSLFRLEVEHAKTDPYRGLKPQQISQLGILFKNVKVLIIDEISMVSNILLAKLHRRLQEIKKNREAFGGVFLVVFGDLLQLPPVRISPPFCAINPRLVHQIFHCIPTELKLWDKFEYRELTENMRQKEDKDYSDVLNRIRIGSPIDEDYEKLLNRCISVLKEGDQWTKDKPIPRPIYLAEAVEYFIALRESTERHNAQQTDPKLKKSVPLAAFARSIVAKQFNEAVIMEDCKNGGLVRITAKDTITTFVKNRIGKLRRPFQVRGYRRQDIFKPQLRKERPTELPDDPKRCGGLSRTLLLREGCRVMLTRNILTSKGLVNGAMGTLIKIVGCDSPEGPSELSIQLEGMEKEVTIEKLRVLFNPTRGTRAARFQFPIINASAMTIHKCQGISCDDVIVDLTDLFSAGQAYVALSRARNLNGVHIINMQPSSIFASVACVEEYNRLRETIRLPALGEANKQPDIVNCFTKKIDKNVWPHIFINNGQLITEEFGIANGTAVEKKRGRKKGVPNKKKKTGQPAPKRKILQKKNNTTNGDSMAAYVPDSSTALHSTNEAPDEINQPAMTVPAVPTKEVINWENRRITRSAKPVPFGMRNLRNTCYANSVVQASIRMWRPEIEHYEGNDPYLQALKEIVTAPYPKDAKPLLFLKDMPQNYRNVNIQQSAAELIGLLIDRISPEFQLQVAHTSSRFVTCHLCKQRRQTGHPAIQGILTISGENDHYRTFNEFVHSILRCSEPTKQHCEQTNCLARNCDHDEELAVTIPPTCRYLLMELGLFANDRITGISYRRDRTIGNPNRREKLFGTWFKPVAAIWHMGETPFEGHYMAYIENDDHWIKCNDSRIAEEEFPRDMEGIVVMVMERLNEEDAEMAEMEMQNAEAGGQIVEEMVDLTSSRAHSPTEDLQRSTSSVAKKLLIERGNIVDMDVDIIVNAANPQLKQGKGVDGAVRKACGLKLINEATDKISRKLPGNELAPGQVVATDSFNLKRCKKIFHTAAPYIQPGRQPTRRQEKHLRSCYYNSLALADQEGHSSIAFPILGIGLYNYDEEKGMRTALEAIFSYFKENPSTNLNTVKIVAVSANIVRKMQTLAGGVGTLSLD